jgi:stage V sporulation protein D (sporulation-specific penicillin-binding protein)
LSQVLENRLRLFSILLILVALVLIGKLYFVQIVRGESFRDRAEHQYVAGANYFDRGSIFFTTKDGVTVPAASVKTGFILAINPQLLRREGKVESTYEALRNLTPIERDVFLAKAERTDPYEEISRRLTAEVAEKIQDLKLPGVSVYKERWRVYPGETMAAHTVGFIGYKGDELGGRYGLERFYESTLKREGDDAFVNFFAEIFSNVKDAVSQERKLEGDIVTTIEPSVEAFLEGELLKVNTKYSSDFTAGIIINPKNGEIYAMAETPTFNPNTPQNEKSSSIFRNKFVEDRYELGSIVKALTLAIGLDSGAITAKTTYNDPGCMTLNRKTFCNYDGQSHGYGLPMQRILNQSLNTGSAFVALKVGNAKFSEYMLKFGLGEKTGIDLPNEGANLVSNLNTNRDLEHATASFGQGIAVTPVTAVRAFSALANGGYLITPHLAKEVKYKIGTSNKISYPPGEQVLKPETSEEISRMLTEVVDTAIRNGGVRLPNYSVAAKTGTAQIASPGGGYYEDRYLHSFFGYFPSYDPQFLVFLYTYHPKNVQYASETLTDTFINLTKFLLNYYNVPPDREAPPTKASI